MSDEQSGGVSPVSALLSFSCEHLWSLHVRTPLGLGVQSYSKLIRYPTPGLQEI